MRKVDDSTENKKEKQDLGSMFSIFLSVQGLYTQISPKIFLAKNIPWQLIQIKVVALEI